jgi:hypothetical protein
MLDLILFCLVFGFLFLALIGAFTLYHLCRPKKSPADESNRINHIRLWWFALTRENLFVDTFEWLKHDELDNVKK